MAKKAVSAFLAALLCLGMFFAVLPGAMAATAYAQTGMGTLTVNGPATMVGKNVYAVKMFSIADDGGKNYAYTLDSNWEGFFKGLSESSMDALSGTELSEAAYAYVLNLKGDDLNGFAALAQDYVRGDGAAALGKLVKTAGPAQKTDSGASASFVDLEYGYYVVYPAQGSTSTSRHTDATLVNVPDNTGSANVSWNIKSEYPTVDKTIVETPENGLAGFGVGIDDSWEGEHNMGIESLAYGANDPGVNGASANIGDTLSFKLTSVVPDMTDYDRYTFKLHDTLSKGLTMVNTPTDPKVVVKVNGTDLDGDQFTRAGVLNDDGTTSLAIDLSAYLSDNKHLAGSAIEVWYSAVLNEHALIEEPNTNSAHVEYSTEPGSTEHGVPDITKTYTLDFMLDKRAESATGKPLANAQFKIYFDANENGAYDADTDTAMHFVAGTDANEGMWLVSKNGSETVQTGAQGTVSLAGFAEGTYFIVETAAPEGYNPLEDPIKVVVKGTYSEDGTLTDHVVDYGDLANGIDDKNGVTTEGVHHTITIVNKSGAQLPGTGGMGTFALTAIGVIVVAAGIALVIRRNRKEN